MEVEVKEALRTLTDGNIRVDAHQYLGLREQLELVDNKFRLLRTEINRLNGTLAEQRDINNALHAALTLARAENAELKTTATTKPTSPTSGNSVKKKTTKKKK